MRPEYLPEPESVGFGMAEMGLETRTSNSGRVRTVLLRCLLVVGIAVTPIWICLIAWALIRLGSWLFN